MGKSIWYGISIGAVIGGGLGDDMPAGNSLESDGGGGIGGAKNFNNDDDSKNGGQGLFSLWGKQVWAYVGGVLGFGDMVGIYFTTGPMIGMNPDWAIGGGIHFGKAIGVGLVIPIRQAMQSYAKHQDKIGAYYDAIYQNLIAAQNYVNNVIDAVPNATGCLEQIVNKLC